MANRTLSIRVPDSAARIYETASEDDRRRLDALLSLRLAEAARPVRPLEDVIRDLGRRARDRGLTPETLDEILHVDD